MTFTSAHVAISLDGFLAGPDQSLENPLGRGGLALHQWHFDSELPGREVDARWTAKLDRALARAREVGDGDVLIAGGASTIRQALATGVLDELTIAIAPVLLGTGERIFDADTVAALEVVEAEHSALATHVRYRIRH